MKSRIKQVTKEVEQLKKDFALAIKDKSVPLDDRWDLFSEAPDWLSKHEGFIVHFPFRKMPNGEDIDRWMYDGHSRGSLSTMNVVERVEGEQWQHDGSSSYKESNYTKFHYPKEFVDQMKEFFLDNNIKSWEYDW